MEGVQLKTFVWEGDVHRQYGGTSGGNTFGKSTQAIAIQLLAMPAVRPERSISIQNSFYFKISQFFLFKSFHKTLYNHAML